MKTVAVFGCSYTEGVNHGRIHKTENNWPLFFSKIYKGPVINYAIGGTSIEFALSNMLEYKKHKPKSICVFQATHPYRFTVDVRKKDWQYTVNNNYTTAYKLRLLRYMHNLKHCPIDVEDNISKKQIRITKQRYIDYLKSSTDKELIAEYFSILDTARSSSDFCYIHNISGNHNIPVDVPYLKALLGKDFLKFSQDTGFHFSKQGNKWVADWVYNNIKDLL